MAPKRAAAASTEAPSAKKQNVAPKAAAATPSPKSPAKAAAAAKAAATPSPKQQPAAAAKQTPVAAAPPAAAAAAKTPAAAATATPAAAAETPKVDAKVAPKVVKGKKTGKKVGSLRVVGGKRQWVSGKKMEKKTAVLYVGHLPHGFYEYELRRYLGQYGSIKRLRVSRNPKTGKSRGYAFVQFESPNVAEKAAVELRGMYLSEKVLRAAVMKPHLVDNNIWKGSDNHLRLLDARRRRDGPNMKAKPAGVAYAKPENVKRNTEDTVKRHDAAVKKSHINYQFNPNVTL